MKNQTLPKNFSRSGFYFPANFRLQTYICGYKYRIVKCGEGFIALFKSEKDKLACFATAQMMAQTEGLDAGVIFYAYASKIA